LSQILTANPDSFAIRPHWGDTANVVAKLLPNWENGHKSFGSISMVAVRGHATQPKVMRCIGPQRAGDLVLRAEVERTSLFSLRENAIAKEPGSSYLKPWRCVSRLGLLIGGLDSFESSP